MSRRRFIVATVLSLLTLPAVLAWFVLYTEAGARWVLGLARDATGDALAWQRIDGSIAGGLTLGELTFVTDGVEIAVVEIAAAASPSLFPPAVAVGPVDIRDLRVSLDGGDQPPDSASDTAALLESLRLPLPVSIESLEATGVTVASDGATLTTLDRVQLALRWHETLELESFTVDGGPVLAASGSAVLGLDAPFSLDARLGARADTALPTPVDGSLVLSGSLASLDVTLAESVSGLELTGTASTLLDNPRWDLEATVAALELDAEAGIGIRDAALRSAGSLDAYQLEAALGITSRIDATPLRVARRATGSGDGLDVELLELGHPTARLSASGRLDFPAAFAGAVEIRDVRLDRWLPALDGAQVLSGTVDTTVTTERLALQNGRFVVDGTSIGVDVGGTVDLASGDVDARLEWQALEWPLVDAAPRIRSREGKAQISGTLDAWSAEISATVSAPDIAEGRLVTTGAGSRSAAAFEIVDGDVFGGAVTGSAEVDWSEELRWSAELFIRGLRTGAVLPSYPGILTTHLRASADGVTDGVDIELVDLRGNVLDESLSGGGELSLAPGAVIASDFRIAHGDARLALDGSLFAASGLDFEFAVPELGLYRPSFAGDLDVAGRMSLQDDAPTLALNASSRAIRLGDFGIDDLSVATSANESGGVDLGLRAANVAYGMRKVDDVNLDAVIDADQQQVKLTMTPLGNQVTLAVQGSMSEPGKLSGFPWTGTLEEFTLVTRAGEGGGLDGPVPVEFAPGLVRIEDLCMSGETRGELCATIEFDAAAGLVADGVLEGVPVDVLNAFLQTGFDFEQAVSGTLRWDSRADGGPSGRLALNFTPGQLTSSRFPSLDLRTGEGEVSFEVASGQLLSGKVILPLGAQGYIEGEFNMEDISLGADSPVRGALNARTSDVDVFAVLLPDIDGAKGRLKADLALGGTASRPIVTGSAAFNDGELNYFPLGLTLTDINVDGRFDENRHVDLGGTFQAGEGRGQITTRTSGGLGEAPGIHVRIRGERLQVIELPDISAVANADLTIDYRSQRVDIDGSVDIPRARIRPVNLVTGRVDESDDVVIVAGTLPDESEARDRSTELAVHGRLALGVGDDVRITLDLARASIDGDVEFRWDGDPVPNGRGRYNINGTVQAFGQVLNISEGRVSFPDVPATEPLLDIRATREIFGNTQIKRAGIFVQGSVQRPTIEAYTIPVTTEERALTLLVTGNDFDYEQGVGAIDFGTYIAPRLFLSYGVGVFDRENIVSARYDLTTGFGIRATSGSRESGVDLTYRLDR